MKVSNLLRDVPTDLPSELSELLHGTPELRIERIVSRGHSSPPGHWYDQDEHEWVLVVAGKARLQFEVSGDVVHLESGDYLEIPARVRHRVEWTDPDQKTVWLAVFYRTGGST